ncbi:interferon related developmental regulator 2 [Rhinolophus ferrumequinum]|uniref:Interferon related developmental regulator 2 n=1 Tax=Rhinolophus ferrumequinum TaxID=59479 RepID=A0A7J7UJC8_RHIFE|nr:interferon related developmental regulator 2 [Rhinolophus ferrumequinum]
MPRARKDSAPRKGGQRRRGGARSSIQADSGSSEDEAASEARSTTSDCPSLLSTVAEDSLGKGEEQALAAAVVGLLCVQLGPGPKGEELFHSLQPLLVSVLSDNTASPAARLHCASALGVGCYVAAADVQDLVSCLTCLEGVFSRSCGVSGPTAPVAPASLHGLFCAVLQAWALLLTICPSTHVSHILDRRTSFTRTWTPSAVPCALWPLTAASTVPNLTVGGSALLSVPCCTLWRCV